MKSSSNIKHLVTENNCMLIYLFEKCKNRLDMKVFWNKAGQLCSSFLFFCSVSFWACVPAVISSAEVTTISTTRSRQLNDSVLSIVN